VRRGLFGGRTDGGDVKPDEAKYAEQLGDDALARQRAEAKVRCVLCWAPPGRPHTATCPNLPADEDALPVEQTEGLF
jgi:hypothetical protein